MVTTLEHRYQKTILRLVPMLRRWDGKRTTVTSLEHRYQKITLRLVPMFLRWNEKKKMTQW
jgi:hypothetical protein